MAATKHGFERSTSGRYMFSHNGETGRTDYAVERSATYGGWLLFRVTPETRYGDGWMVAVEGAKEFAPRYALRIRPRVFKSADAACLFARGLAAAEVVGSFLAKLASLPTTDVAATASPDRAARALHASFLRGDISHDDAVRAADRDGIAEEYYAVRSEAAKPADEDADPVVAEWARDFACDCVWADDDGEHAVTRLRIRSMSDADVIRTAARHYDGGIAALTADAHANADLQARADADARARGYTGNVATPGAQRERLAAHKEAAKLSMTTVRRADTAEAREEDAEDADYAHIAKLVGTADNGDPAYVVRRLHSGTEDGPLWYVVRVSDGVRVSGGWLNQEDAEHDCQALLDGSGRVVAWAACETCQRMIDVSTDEASSFECCGRPMARGWDVEPVADGPTAKAEDDAEARRAVVVDMESHRLGWIVGDYSRTDEAAVIYSDDCGREHSAPIDCVRVIREDEARATGVAPLVTRAQLETVDKLADAIEMLERVPVRIDVVPDVTADADDSAEAGAVLVLVTPDADGPADPVTWVWASDGASRYPCSGHYTYASATQFVQADGHRPIIQRAGTSVFRVLPGGSYDRRRF